MGKMTKTQVQKIVEYWRKTAKRDYDTMLGLFKIKRYPESLFYGHILLEKILKALVVQKTTKGSPYSHDLVRLQQLAELNLNLENIEFLKEVNNFNIRSRYPDYKLKFHKLCTKQFVETQLDIIIKLYKKLCQKLK